MSVLFLLSSKTATLIRNSCWYSHPPGNKITDAGVLLYTPRQHQDVVPRRQQHPHSVHLRFSKRGYRKGKRLVGRRDIEMDRWCFHSEFLLFVTLASVVYWGPGCLQYSVLTESTLFSTGRSSTFPDVIQLQSWRSSCWRKMWACSGPFHVLFSH